ncbi:type I-E CRISPR-associated protein Cas7/Cse4/CasC [Candidatus Venteria ishoeyi]|uniref:type I-E CRISPR-associated protein Cas7/Cse4/CasC n=1 Tax=Candidatus Venteria ishoeyi TaxID=1899563 RepID=UPI0025A4D7A1|nr:type I-E CRISPR-associated protein Cas7/Cse4/CasC [Candidatus Venteria ishoeyi]MDM8545407.1 type I-E CRISPR-associated protein Cas7/Cse4/CasC [Candidatus Venteria ishoeyi]
MTTTNPFQSHIIEFHILQSFPVSCLNRDDVGSPKSAIVGGMPRARVSSQCWKRQVRLAMQDFGIKLAIRSKHITAYVAKACLALGANEEQANTCGEAIAKAFSKDTLHFFTDGEAQAFAQFALEREFDATQIKDKEIQKLAKKVLKPAVDGLDIALFGRMVAQAAELNIEAACSFAHAISTHKANSEVEFFTALDDLQDDEETGSAHMGSLEFNAATYYRYISLDLGQLYQTLDGQGLDKAVAAFTKALFVAVPSARQTTQSAASPWEYANILVRKGQRLQAPFETAVKAKNGGFLQPSIEALSGYLSKKEKLSGSLFGKIAQYQFGEDENFSIDDLVAALKTHAEA